MGLPAALHQDIDEKQVEQDSAEFYEHGRNGRGHSGRGSWWAGGTATLQILKCSTHLLGYLLKMSLMTMMLSCTT